MTTHPLPARLRELREAKGLSRAALALSSGVPFSAIENIERGRTPTPGYTTFLALARALRVSPDALAAEAELVPVKRGRGRPARKKTNDQIDQATER